MRESIVAGAGIWGCTVARRLAEAGHLVRVLEKRTAVGGNVRCETDPETGIEVHLYGSHIFHTHLDDVWTFVNRFVTFNGYQHKVLARYQGKTYFLPLGLALVNKFFGTELEPSQLESFMKDERHANAIFDAFFRGYTSKQWGRPPEEIDPSIIRRVPVRSNYDVNYFNDYNQGIPLTGYNSLFDRLLDHPNITVSCSTPFVLDDWLKDPRAAETPVYYSGPIDALFGFCLGHLPWRTLRFETEKLDVADFQGTSVVNYTEASVPFTRIHEFRHYHPERQADRPVSRTIITREYSAAWQPGDEPYYPIDTPESRTLLERYRQMVDALQGRCRLVVGGRLGGYKYYDMDKSVESALHLPLDL